MLVSNSRSMETNSPGFIPEYLASFSGARVTRKSLDDIFDSRGCWEANCEVGESCSQGRNLYMGKSNLWNGEVNQGEENRDNPWENLPFHCFNCKNYPNFSFCSSFFDWISVELFPYFILWQGSSKTGILGEASINFADYEETTEPLTVSLPLQTLNSGAILHVSSLSIPWK